MGRENLFGTIMSIGNTAPSGTKKKKIKGHEYYYLVARENGRVRFIYKGKFFGSSV